MASPRAVVAVAGALVGAVALGGAPVRDAAAQAPAEATAPVERVATETIRESRPAMGTVVGVTIRSADPERARESAETAYATIDLWEARLSEWRPDSLVSRVNDTGGPVPFPPEAMPLFVAAERMRLLSDGAFDVAWQGGRLILGPNELRVEPPGAKIGLGGILKGFLVDRAVDALLERGERDFLVDAAGDVAARGGAAAGERGWRVELPALDRVVVLQDAALSSSGEDFQPGHLVDPRTGQPATCSRAVTVVAPEGVIADGLATAIYVGCDEDLAAEANAVALRRDGAGRLRGSPGAARVFRRQ